MYIRWMLGECLGLWSGARRRVAGIHPTYELRSTSGVWRHCRKERLPD